MNRRAFLKTMSLAKGISNDEGKENPPSTGEGKKNIKNQNAKMMRLLRPP